MCLFGVNMQLKGKKFLITHTLVQNIMGSTVVALELADYLQQNGASVEIFTGALGNPCKEIFQEKSIIVHDNEFYNFDLEQYDYIWVQSQLLPVSIVDQLSKPLSHTPIFIFNHMSSLEYAPDEHPYIYTLEDRISSLSLFVSQETMNKLSPFYSSDVPKQLFRNPAPKAFEELPLRHQANLRHILIVSNHMPPEISEAAKILHQRGYEIHHIGENGSEYKLLTPDILRKADAVISIGKTVQYCLVSGIPVYIYDHFGGFGYLNEANYKLAEFNNFSGRGGIKRNPDEIADDIIQRFDEAFQYQSKNREKFVSDFSIDKTLSSLFEHLTPKSLSPLDTSFCLPLRSAESFAHRYYRTRAFMNNVVPERDDLHNENDNLSKQIVILQERCTNLEKEISRIKSSEAFKLGRLITRPFHYMKETFKSMLPKNRY